MVDLGPLLPLLHLDQENLQQPAVLSSDHVSHLIILDLPLESFTPLLDLNNHIVEHPLHPNHQSLQPVLDPFRQYYPTRELPHPALLLLQNKINHRLHHAQYDQVLAGHHISWQRRLRMMEAPALRFQNLGLLGRMGNRHI